MTSPGEIRRVAAAAVPGCQHVLAGGTPCQDAVATRITANRVILAVSDGHGDVQYTHSDEGARIAVAVAVEVLGVVADRLVAQPPYPSSGVPSSSDLEGALEHEIIAPLKRRIAFEWNRRVKHHARMVAARDGWGLLWPDEVTGDWDEKVKPYGCTLLAVVITNDVALWLRLGDGEALAVDGALNARRVYPGSDKSMGQATYSLSMRSCIEHMVVKLEPKTLELALLATDGVADQYELDPTFEDEWGTNVLERIRTNGWTAAMMDLPRSLGIVARDGDDCSVALAWLPATQAHPDELASTHELPTSEDT